ncbi:hypothetical protein LTR29_007213 [Friedmanniomyces endolithicus]|nr:hypothetical protein LTR29_007213 [Friedmanniomyces endolithicus]
MCVVLVIRLIEELVASWRPLVRADDELAQELVAQAVEIVAVEFGGGALFEVALCWRQQARSWISRRAVSIRLEPLALLGFFNLAPRRWGISKDSGCGRLNVDIARRARQMDKAPEGGLDLIRDVT